MDLDVRRTLEVFGEVVPWLVDADRAAADLDAEVGACELREHVRYRVLADRGAECAWMAAEKPVGHEPAIGEAHDASPIAVGESFVDCPIGDAQDIGGILSAPMPGDGAGIFLAIAGGASGVGPNHVESSARQRGDLEPRRRSVRKVGTAMHGDDQRGFARLAMGAQKPSVDVVPVGMRDLDTFDWAAKGPEPFAAIVGEPAELAAFDREDVRRPVARGDD